MLSCTPSVHKNTASTASLLLTAARDAREKAPAFNENCGKREKERREEAEGKMLSGFSHTMPSRLSCEGQRCGSEGSVCSCVDSHVSK